MTALAEPPHWWNAETATARCVNTGPAGFEVVSKLVSADVARLNALHSAENAVLRTRFQGAFSGCRVRSSDRESGMDKVAAALEQIAADAAEAASDEVKRLFNFLSPQCESEIERMLALGLIHMSRNCPFRDYAAVDFFRDDDPAKHYGLSFDDRLAVHAEQFGKGYLVGVTCQQKVGPYRLDFRLRCAKAHGPREEWRWLNIAVECDGHDFHEKTKAQAQRDKARDRYLVSAGYRILRFTGAEIWNDPVGCADQVFDLNELFFLGEL